ncbi:hypothetical protein P691DRAFT_777849 [Macrolepiota fuliginosa MF-IS2]|uniref:Uncharacterized protein n=1 Tax=Macrolepiota fuliginosa MF-IS2 TaxID=1400762 RepID=A0A9P5X560_9AGAR|nr:hypothetical protein P691DRAFT_777849 [Macrolepiota fuliginosa MF-IS2]
MRPNSASDHSLCSPQKAWERARSPSPEGYLSSPDPFFPESQSAGDFEEKEEHRIEEPRELGYPDEEDEVAGQPQESTSHADTQPQPPIDINKEELIPGLTTSNATNSGPPRSRPHLPSRMHPRPVNPPEADSSHSTRSERQIDSAQLCPQELREVPQDSVGARRLIRPHILHLLNEPSPSFTQQQPSLQYSEAPVLEDGVATSTKEPGELRTCSNGVDKQESDKSRRATKVKDAKPGTNKRGSELRRSRRLLEKTQRHMKTDPGGICSATDRDGRVETLQGSREARRSLARGTRAQRRKQPYDSEKPGRK